ncbi:DUF4371 domain-containing protein [Trichonephila clavipes]|uniref:DUF4371 domain-containing protein n=1 Tax=Trichonephila clavipes TaxID=2585209 RepID=A0A8X7BDJ1_TRICX|nr:DUF4371 domain-containing protein [Trichonephila clavipes]
MTLTPLLLYRCLDESIDITKSARLAVFARYCVGIIKEELIAIISLLTTTKGTDICTAVKNSLAEKEIDLKKIVSVTTDDASNMGYKSSAVRQGEDSDKYKNNKEFIDDYLDSIISDRKSKEEQVRVTAESRLEFEKINLEKVKLEIELGKINLERAKLESQRDSNELQRKIPKQSKLR